MEEFDQSTVSEIDGREIGEEFYERIEAPKFVDFTVPDHYRPDDRYWFCLRVGCDQKHEEELDPEAIYKDFVLRVMAARSPNIKIRKMLNRIPPSSTLKCPLTAPAKSSKSRISRLAVVSSISRKLVDAKDKAKPYSKTTATPKASLKQSSSAAKAFTTPRNRKRISNPDKFRSVQNPKPTTSIVVPKTRVVAKALVFHSPKKTGRIKTSLELKTPVGKLCAAMSRLEIASGKKKPPLELKTPVGKLCAAMSKLEIASGQKQTLGCNKPLPSEKTRRKQFRGREVKSRVYDSLHSHSRKGQEKKPLKNMKRKKREKDSEQSCDPVKDNDSSDMEIDERLRHGLIEGCSVSDTTKNGETNGHEILTETSKGVIIPNSSSSKERALGDGDQNSQDIIGLVDKASDSHEQEEKVKLSKETNSPKDMDSDDKENALPLDDKEEKVKLSEGTNSPKDMDNNDKENTLPSDGTENDGEAIECDDKENASASDDNREHFHSNGKVLSNHGIEKVNQVKKKPSKKSSIATPCAQEAKYRKPKPTNPKPFRLRTDERGILKEATLEKKLVTPLKEITTSVKPSGLKPLRNNQNSSRKNENCRGQCGNENVSNEDGKKSMVKADMDQLRRTKITSLRITTTTAKKCPQVEGTILEKSSERTKSAKTFARPQGIGSSRKTARLGVIKEVEKQSANGASKGAKASSGVPRSESRGRRPTTIPKVPNFHSIHIPKSCAKKVVA